MKEMDGGIASTGPANLQDSLPRPGVEAGAKASALYHAAVVSLVEDEIAGSLLDLAKPGVGRVLDHLEHARSTLDQARLDVLLQTAIDASSSGDKSRALTAVSELVRLHPERGAQMVRESAALAPVRVEVTDLMQRLESGAKTEAERVLRAASLAIDSAGARGAPAASYQQMLELAQRFFDTGQHLNFVRAAELGQTILAFYPATSIPAGATGQRARRATAVTRKSSPRRISVAAVLGWGSLAIFVIAVLQYLLRRL